MDSRVLSKIHLLSHSSFHFFLLFFLFFITSNLIALPTHCTATAIPAFGPPQWDRNGNGLPTSGDISSVVVKINDESEWLVRLSLFAGSCDLPKGLLVNQAEIVWASTQVFCIFYIADDDDDLADSNALRERTDKVRKGILSQIFTNDDPLTPGKSFLAKRLACMWIP